jgi:transcriptional regulator, CarD family
MIMTFSGPDAPRPMGARRRIRISMGLIMTETKPRSHAAASKGASRKTGDTSTTPSESRAKPARPKSAAPPQSTRPDSAAPPPATKKGSSPDMTAASKTAAKPTAKPAPESETPDDQPEMPAPEAEAAAPAVERDAMPPPGPRPVLPQRAIAKAENFKPGDHVVYPTHGVGKVDRIAAEEIAGQKLELIHITFDENRMTLRVPVNKARTAGLRKLSSKKSFDEVLATLKGRARVKRTMWSRRAQEYEAKINSGDPMAIAEVVRDLHRNAGQPDQSFSERQIFEAALERLAAEYGALEGLGKQEAIDKLLLFLKSE